MVRVITEKYLRQNEELSKFGLTPRIVGDSINYVYHVLDQIDSQLIQGGGERLSELVELANLSAIIGNLYRSGIIQSSDGKFKSNAPHTYPDLLGASDDADDIEIKVALETNNPKGHLVKPGPHIIIRYVLSGLDGNYIRGKEARGNVAWIWEVRLGQLTNDHFNVSNTEGDSGKTAVINADGMDNLDVIYCDMNRCPLSPRGTRFKKLAALFT